MAAVESWAGTKEEILSVAIALLEQAPSGSDPDVKAHLDLIDGRSWGVTSMDALAELLDRNPLVDVLLLRVDLGPPSRSYGAALVATSNTPGLRIRVWGTEQARSLGAAQLAFHRMMIGYVDRMGGWRTLIWMAAALSPLLLVSIGISPDASNPLARTAVLTVGLVGSVAVFLFAYPRLLVPGGFVLLEQEPGNQLSRTWNAITTLLGNSWARRALSLVGALLVGIFGNKLSDLIPWP